MNKPLIFKALYIRLKYKSKYIRKTPEVINGDYNNKIHYDGITNKTTKAKCISDKQGYAKTKVGVKFELNEFVSDKKGNIWICVQDNTGKQVK